MWHALRCNTLVIRRQSDDGILGAFQTAGLLLALGLLFEPVREAILLSGAAGIGFTTFILVGALVIAVYRFIVMQLRRFSKPPPDSKDEPELEWESMSSASR